MRVLIFHGYLLRGTGSNVYNASLAQALARLGHEVHLLCQDRRAGELQWVRSVGGGGSPGTVTVHLPDIGGLLPVYVPDAYEGFEVKAFPELGDSELDRYIEANVRAVSGVVEGAGAPDAALANHLVMGPVILARAGLGARQGGPGFAIKIHGSALEYTVKPNPDRFLPLAREGIAAGSGVLVGSRHTAESLWEAIGDPHLPERTRLGPPGVDTELFAPVPDGEKAQRLRGLAQSLAETGGEADPASRAGAAWGRESQIATEAIAWLAEADVPRVVFVGKLIVSKGVDLLLAAWPLVVAANPGARLLIIGFGEYRDALVRLWEALGRGDLDEARDIAARGRELEGGKESRLAMLDAFLADPPAGYVEACTKARGSVRFAGRLEHDEVGALMPAADALVFPSTFPESFGMVAAEAAAAGVLPVGAAHSGIVEVSRELASALPAEAADLVSFELGEGAIERIAERVNRWLTLDESVRKEARAALRETVARLWSWEGVARGMLGASRNELDELPRVPSA